MSGRRIARRVAWAVARRFISGGREPAPTLATKVLGLRPSPFLASTRAIRARIRGSGGFWGGPRGSLGGCCRVAWWGTTAATAYPKPSLVTKEGMGGGL